MSYQFKPESLLGATELPFDFSPYVGDPDLFAGSHREKRLKAMLGDPKEHERARDLLMELRRQSCARRESKSKQFGPYLTFRKDRDTVVIQDGRTQVSTRIKRIAMLAPEDHPRAIEELADYIARQTRSEQVLKSPDDIPLRAVFDEYLKSFNATGMRHERLQNLRNHASWLMEFAGDRTLRYVDDDFGKHFVMWRLLQPARTGKTSDDRSLSMEAQQYFARRSFDWILKKLRKLGAVRLPELSFTIQKGRHRNRRALTWMEFVWLLLACLGFQRVGNTFKTKTVIRRGVARLTWDLAPSKKTRWLMRFFLIYLCTGTRFARNQKLVWGTNDNTGALDPEGREICRSGRQQIVAPNKPAGRSDLTPAFAAMVRKWYRQDLRLSKAWKHPPIWVLHDGKGDRLRDVENLARTVFARAGLENSSHVLKHTCVTLHALYGYTHEDLADQTDTGAGTLKKHYSCPWAMNRRRRQLGIPVSLTRLADLGKTSALPALPELAASAVATLPRSAR